MNIVQLKKKTEDKRIVESSYNIHCVKTDRVETNKIDQIQERVK